MSSSSNSTVLPNQTDTLARPRPFPALLERYAPLLGRIGLSMIFLISGLGKIAAFEQTGGYMASKGMPLVSLFLVGAIALEVLGGLSILLGFKAKLGAAALLIFLIPATLIFHNFWAFDGMQRQMEMINFLKNVSIGGGLLLVLAYGAGSLSLDARRSSK